MKNRLVLFSHFDPDGIIDHYVLKHLEFLKDRGADIYFVSTAPFLCAQSMQNAMRFCKIVLTRMNVGYDFASWRDAWNKVESIASYDFLYLINDSNLGPLSSNSLKKLLDAIEYGENDFAGMTSNSEIKYHIQSYFMFFRLSDEIIRFLDAFFVSIDEKLGKDEIIKKYEIGLTELALDRGFKVGAVIEIDAVIKNHSLPEDSFSLPINHWDLLLDKYEFPFIKRDLFTKIRSVNKEDLYKKLVDVGADTGLIKTYFDRTLEFWNR